ncbi:MAG: tetratricopeptide repeat protein [Brevinema sp.]
MSQSLVSKLELILSESAQNGTYGNAIDRYLQLLEDNPEAVIIYFYLGLVSIRLNNVTNGIRYLEMARSAELDMGQKFRCLIFLGKAYADVKAYSKAERMFREALQTGVPEPGAYSAIGAIFYERSMIDQSIDALRKALDIDPNYPGALNNLGYILVETKRNVEEGIRLCTKAVEVDAKNPAYRDSLGKALMAAGYYTEAEEQLKKALELSPEDNIVAEHLVELRQKMERK